MRPTLRSLAIGLLTLVGLVSRRWDFSVPRWAFLTPFVILSFLVTTPQAWVPTLGDAQHGSGAGRLVLKDVLLLTNRASPFRSLGISSDQRLFPHEL